MCAVEWALTGSGPKAVSALRREVMAYLRRHGEPDSDFAAAEIVVAELLNNAFEHAPGPAWVRASWARERPRLEVHDLGPGFTLNPNLPQPEAEPGRGLFLVNAIADDVAVAANAARIEVDSHPAGAPSRADFARSAAPQRRAARARGSAR